MKQILTILLLIVGAMAVHADNLSEAEYYQKKAESYQREAMDKAKTQQRYAKEADEKAAKYLRWATQ